MTEIERLARVVWAAGAPTPFANGNMTWEQAQHVPSRAEECRTIVRAVLTALREPSEGMVEAMARANHKIAGEYNNQCTSWSAAFTAAIDVLLSDGAPLRVKTG